ncbi:trans-aconitate 2-methyltransferase [Micromonospora sp. HUAS LYJ1]|uniref:class I SAM-dependent methyltransferase n=1 Tax=Micromonospora sp. HUAS LYJ1 TaxID=3061626 RepID=UPI002672632D|nr:class I SAM-dependent methyltransferase [Micromonospora sp. HUAS LYJ1]WKU07110.1 class I SAM-dependent methyltransferase [Micromonospora sp. HUAS LYJ1]
MSDTDRETLRTVFGQDAARYDRARPGYPDRLFDDLARIAGLDAGARVLEIGSGTGQATRVLAERGYAVHAVELSAEMAAVAVHNLRGLPNVTVEVAAFEEWVAPVTPFDLVLAATAFHWIDPDIRVGRAADVLRPGGTLAVIHTEHVAGGTERFFVDVQGCYERFDPRTPPGLRLTPAADHPRDSAEIDQSGRFGPVEFLRYEWEQSYTTATYLDLLMTYSGTRSLPQPDRDRLLACIGGLIDRAHEGVVTKRYLTQLTLAHRVS